MNWFMQQRQAWIAEMLFVYGFVHRRHLQRKFGIGYLQASRDLQEFARLHREAVRYSQKQQCYFDISNGNRDLLRP